MGFISWIIMGLIVGVLAKLIMPGKDPGGLFITIGIGIAGAFVGGFIGTKLGLGAVTGFNTRQHFDCDRGCYPAPGNLSCHKEEIARGAGVGVG